MRSILASAGNMAASGHAAAVAAARAAAEASARASSPAAAQARPLPGAFTVAVNGLRLEGRDLPARQPGRPTLVLLHEGLGCAGAWRKFPDALALSTGCRVVAWSRAGYGGSDPYGSPRTARYLHEEAETALPATLDALGVSAPVLVGHSDGASIALLYAGGPRARSVRGVAALAPHTWVEDVTLRGVRAARAAWDAPGSTLAGRLAKWHADPARVYLDWADTWLRDDFRGWDIREALPRVTAPVLGIQGEQDEFGSMRQLEALRERVPGGATLLKLPRCGHSPHKDAEGAVLRALTDWVAQLGKPQPQQ
jgi:pimeloyl-ACP methyl ester carboxylesterase